MHALRPVLGRLARSAWPFFAVALVALAMAAGPSVVPSVLTPTALAELPSWHMSPQSYTAAVLVSDAIPALTYLLVAAVIWWRARWERMAIACAYMLATYGVLVASPIGSLPQGPAALLLVAAVGSAVGQFAAPLFFFVFPTGTFAPRGLRWVALAGAAVLGALLVPDLLAGRPVTTDAVQTVGVALFLVGVVAQIVRYVRTSDSGDRAQVRWVVYGLCMAALVLAVSRLIALLLPASLRNSEVGGTLIGGGSIVLALTIVPVCIGVAVLRAGLWNVDRVVNRTVVYALLSAAVVGIYVTVVTYLGAQIRAPSLLASLTATGVVALVLQPLQRLLQRTINRFMFGLRDDPSAVVAELGRRLQDTADAEAVLETAAGTLARALKLPFVGVRMRDGTEAVCGEPTSAPTITPLVFQGRRVGELRLGLRRPGEALSPRDLALVAQVAPQIAAAGDAILLTSDLRASRARLVEAREDERRRLRRDLHDGLGPALAGLALQAAAIPAVATSDPHGATRLGESLAAGIRTVISDVRRLVYGLRPPALDELGLVQGLRSTAGALERPGALAISVEERAPLPRLPAAVEAAAYRIALEAVANAARHAGATRCTVLLAAGEALSIDVTDDGVGIAPDVLPGVGLLGMRERAAEVGGRVEILRGTGRGTIVRALLPLDGVAASEAGL